MLLASAARRLHGETISRQEVAGLALLETEYPAGLRLPRHSHEQAGFCFVLRGAFERARGGATQDCPPESLSFHPPDESHAERFDNAGTRLFSILLTRGLLDRVREYPVVRGGPAFFRGGPPSLLAMRLRQEARRMDEVSPLAIEGLALELLAETSRLRAPRHVPGRVRWLARARELLHARFAEPLTLDEVARAVNVHPVHLARVFRQRQHCTVGEYLRHLRVEFARRQLASTDLPLCEIALLAGFCSQSHLSTTFKLNTGMTPTEYRSSFRSR
jgi:AraC family transcriptional regulator